MNSLPSDQTTEHRGGQVLRPRTSRLSVIALGLNIPCFLPPFTLAAVLLGIIAFVRVRRRGDLGGTALAAAAVILGALLTAVSALPWWNFYQVTTQVPAEAMSAIAHGDGDAIRRIFSEHAAMLSADEIAQFAQELDRRYGAFIEGSLQRAEGQPRRDELWVLPYEMRFERATVPTLVGVSIGDVTAGQPMFGIAAMQLIDAKAGDLRFPPRSRTLRKP